MIQLQNLTPRVYYNESRDFQFIGRLYDVVLNSVKTNADLLYNLPINDCSTDEVLTLLSMSFGFKPKHDYSLSQLKSLLLVFNYATRNKGSLAAIEAACNALLRSEGISQTVELVADYLDKFNYYLFISAQLSDITLLQDFLDYITPAGITISIIRELQFALDEATTTTRTYDNVAINVVANSPISIVPKITNDLTANPIGTMSGHFGNAVSIQKITNSPVNKSYSKKEDSRINTTEENKESK